MKKDKELGMFRLEKSEEGWPCPCVQIPESTKQWNQALSIGAH